MEILVEDVHRAVIIDEDDAPVTSLFENVEELNEVQKVLSYFYGVLHMEYCILPRLHHRHYEVLLHVLVLRT